MYILYYQLHNIGTLKLVIRWSLTVAYPWVNILVCYLNTRFKLLVIQSSKTNDRHCLLSCVFDFDFLNPNIWCDSNAKINKFSGAQLQYYKTIVKVMETIKFHVCIKRFLRQEIMTNFDKH